ncbi:hypothetical protein AHF37_11533 [Paragonimus kellicotti]|nr:hypothetical protein AHF37_11533 [Paragonimus kellicotti]
MHRSSCEAGVLEKRTDPRKGLTYDSRGNVSSSTVTVVIHCTTLNVTIPFTRHNQPPKSVALVDCNAYCFKWAVKTDDHKRMIRNCSTALNTKMEKYLVCITESRSDFGFLCFCNKDKCNHTIRLQHNSLSIPLMIIVSCLLSVVDF